jgi:hypothetical protein
MATDKVLSPSHISFDNGLDIFSTPASNLGVVDYKLLEFKAVNSYLSEGCIRFYVPNVGSSYIFLPDTRLKLKARILQSDNTPLPSFPDPPAEGQQPTEDEKKASNIASVAPVNAFLHSLFDQIECSFNDVLVSTGNTNYSYKAMLNMLLNTSDSVKKSRLQDCLFFPDTPKYLDNLNVGPDSGNTGIAQRAKFTEKSKIVEMTGQLYVDVFSIVRYLLNGISISLNLYSTNTPFRLLSGNNQPQYKVEIVDVSLFMAFVTPSNQVLIAHQEVLKSNTLARYYFIQQDLRRFIISKGSTSYFAENIFNGNVPDKMILAFCDASRVSGQYNLNPYKFDHFFLNFMNITINGQTWAKGVIKTDFENGSYSPCFEDLFNVGPRPNGPDPHFSNGLTREAFENGFCIFQIDMSPTSKRGNFFPLKKEASVRIELRFAKPLSETIILFALTDTPNFFTIDFARNIYLGR